MKTLRLTLLHIITILALSRLDAQIPGVQQQPQWAMPFFFEDANGDKDTVWIGYDPDAKQGIGEYDSIFFEWQAIDTSAFNVVLCPGCYSPLLTTPKDSAYRIDIQSTFWPQQEVGFINGKMPITMKWDNSKFYSDSLPYPDYSPKPKGRANMRCSNGEPPYFYCYTATPHPPLILSDYWIPDFQFTQVFSDSFFFDGSGIISPEDAISISIEIVPHYYPYLGITNQSKNTVKVYPTLFDTKLYIETVENDTQIEVYNILGKLVELVKLNGSINYEIETGTYQPGVYFLIYRTSKRVDSLKIIKG